MRHGFAGAVRCTDNATVFRLQMSFKIVATIGTLLCLGLAVQQASMLLSVPLSSLIVFPALLPRPLLSFWKPIASNGTIQILALISRPMVGPHIRSS